MTQSKDKSIGELLSDLTREVTTLVRKEVQLAKTEISEKVSAAIRGSILLVVAVVFAVFALQALLATAIIALANVVTPWLAALIVGGVLLVVAAICGLIGISKLKQGADVVPHQTVETVKKDVQLVREHI
jgi:uncharacterized membrane protein YqjE